MIYFHNKKKTIRLCICWEKTVLNWYYEYPFRKIKKKNTLLKFCNWILLMHNYIFWFIDSFYFSIDIFQSNTYLYFLLKTWVWYKKTRKQNHVSGTNLIFRLILARKNWLNKSAPLPRQVLLSTKLLGVSLSIWFKLVLTVLHTRILSR